MNDSDFLVSIGLPVYNGGKYLEQAIESILKQTYKNIELIICDNASSDKTSEICQRYQYDSRLIYFRNEKNIGASKNFSKVFNLSKGYYFKWASHDDILGPEFIRDCVKSLENAPELSICVPAIAYIDANGQKMYGQKVADISISSNAPMLRIKKFFDLQVASDDIVYAIFGLIRADILKRTSLWENYLSSEEILMFNILWNGQLKQLDKEEFFFRIHDDSSFKKNKKPSERLLWADPDRKLLFQFPVWNLLGKYLGEVNSKATSFQDKLYGWWLVLYRAIRLWRRYVGDIVKFFGQFKK